MRTSAFMIGFAGLKGGTTKSTLAMLIATKLWHDYPDFRVSVWDLDNQLTVYDRRTKDLYLLRRFQRILEEPEFRNSLEEKPNLKKIKELRQMFTEASATAPLYPVRPYFSPANTKEDYDQQYEKFKNHPDNPIEYFRIRDMEQVDNTTKDLIIVDFPGTIEYKPDMQRLLLRLNAIIIPLACGSNNDIASQKQYCEALQTLLESTNCNFKDNVYMAWTRANKTLYQKKPGESLTETTARVKEKIQRMVEAPKFPFPSITSVIPESEKIKDNTLHSVLPLTNDNLASGAVDVFVKDILSKIF